MSTLSTAGIDPAVTTATTDATLPATVAPIIVAEPMAPAANPALTPVPLADATALSAIPTPASATELLLEGLRRGLAADADDAARGMARDACHALAVSLGVMPAQPPILAVPVPPAPSPSPLAVVVDRLRQMPPDQLLDLAIARLRAALPKDAPPVAPDPVRFQVMHVPVPGAPGAPR